MGCSGSPGWLSLAEAPVGPALVQHSWFLETSSGTGLLGQATGNSSDQGCTFARPVLRLQEGDITARGQLLHSGRHQAREAVGVGAEVSPGQPGPTQACLPPSLASRLTGGAACRGSHPLPRTQSALAGPGSHGSSPPRQPHLPHRAGLPAGTQPGTPPGPSGYHPRSGAAPDPQGWLELASGPGCHWGQEGIEHRGAVWQ